MVGLPTMRVIPTGWQEAHRPVANGTMTGLGRLEMPSGPPAFGEPVGAGTTHLTGSIPCRVQQVRGESESTTGAQRVDTRRYLVTLPLDDVPDFEVSDTGPLFRLTGYQPGHEGDLSLIGRPLRVTNVQRGTLVWERDLTCVDDVTNAGSV